MLKIKFLTLGLILTFSLVCRGAQTLLYPTTVELLNLRDDSPASKIDFEALTASIQYNLSNQYLKVQAVNSMEGVRIYTQGSFLLSGTQTSKLPLYYKVFSSPQSADQISFTPDTESSWKMIVDLQPQEVPSRDLGVTIPIKSGNLAYVYFGTKLPLLDAAPGTYNGGLTVEMVQGATSITEIKPKENILSPNGDRINDFAQFGVSGEFEIKIFDIHGRLIKNLNRVNAWDARDEDGSLVESGVYVYQVKVDQQTISGMLAVER